MRRHVLATVGVTLAFVLAPFASFAATTGTFNAGELIKGSGSTVYYFAPNGKRLVFPNEKTYFTWYTDFSGVKTISDAQLSTVPLGGNVTYRPGFKMVKITTDPRVYVVDQNGMLRHVGSEQLANTMYGLNWKNRIDDVPDAFFVNYRIGTEIQTVSDYSPASVMTSTTTISQDKQFDETHLTVTIGDVNAGFVPSSTTIKAGVSVTWTNADITPHTITGNGWGSGQLQNGDTYTHVFSSTGSFDFHDTNHTVMQGTINVVP